MLIRKPLEIIKRNKSIFILSIVFLVMYSINLDKFPNVSLDENWFANPAYTLIISGKLGTTLLYGYYNAQNFTYWQPPLYLLLLSTAFKFMGFGVLQGRMVSLLLGFMTMLFTYALAKEIYNKDVGIIAASLLTFNLLFFFVARRMRMEIAVACFSLIAIFLIILALKKSNSIYFFLSGIFAMISFLSHPNGLIGILAIYLLIFVYKYSVYHDKLQAITSFFREKGVYLYSLALIITSIPYILYISMDFASFKGQFMANIGHSIFNPLNNIIQEPTRYIMEGYHFYYYIITFLNLSLLEVFIAMMVVLSITIVGVFYLVKNRKLGDKLLLSIFFSQIVLFAILVSSKWFIYLSILLPYWSIVIARIFYHKNLNFLKKKCCKYSLALILIISIFMISNLGAIIYVLSANNNYNYYTLESETSNYIHYNSTIIGDAAYYIALAKNYNYYSQPNSYFLFNEYESFIILKPDYILFSNRYNENSLSIETKEFIFNNYREIGVIPQNSNIDGSPIIIYKRSIS